MTFQYIFLFKIKNVSFYLQTRSIALARKQVWLRGVALNGHRRSLLIWLLERMLRTLTVGKSIYLYALLLFILCISLQSASNTAVMGLAQQIGHSESSDGSVMSESNVCFTRKLSIRLRTLSISSVDT